MKTALVVGAAGFLGRHLCPKLEKAGYRLTTIDPALEPCSPVYDCPTFQEWVGRDNALGMSFNLIVHLGANIPDVDARMKGDVNVYQDIELDLEVARYVQWVKPDVYIYPSSCAVDNPDDPYAWVKLTGERICENLRKQGINVKVLRPFSGYGTDQADSYPFRAILERAIAKENPLRVWGSGNQVRDWIHVDDLTDYIVAVADEKHFWLTPREVGTGIGTSIKDLARMIADEVGYDPAIVGDLSKAESSPGRIANDTSSLFMSGHSATLRRLNPKISLKEGIRRAVKERMEVLKGV